MVEKPSKFVSELRRLMDKPIQREVDNTPSAIDPGYYSGYDKVIEDIHKRAEEIAKWERAMWLLENLPQRPLTMLILEKAGEKPPELEKP